MAEKTKNPTLKVSNFGPINKANIDLRPLTVFVGPSDSGKSYLAILIYALHRSLYKSNNDFMNESHPRSYHESRLNSFNNSFEDFTSKDIIEISKWAKNIKEDIDNNSFKKNHTLEKNDSLPNNDSENIIRLPEAVAQLFKKTYQRKAKLFSEELSRCFAIETKKLIKVGSRENSTVTYNHQAFINSKPHTFNLQYNLVDEKFDVNFSNNFKIELDNDSLNELRYSLRNFRLEKISFKDKDLLHHAFSRSLNNLANIILPHLIKSLNQPTYYLPAGRTGIMQAHKVIVNSLIHSAEMTRRHVDPFPTLSGVVADFLKVMISFDDYNYSQISLFSNNHIKGNHFADKIEKILDGHVDLEREEGKSSHYPKFTYQPKGWNENLPLMNASSMVSELAPIIFFLRYKIKSENVLIIEEPESHLHPKKQVEFIKELAILVKSGIRVIITTHSEWILEGLSNVVHQSEQKPTKNSLLPCDVGVWQFKKNITKGSLVKEIKISEDGIYSSDFDNVALSLHNEWAKI